jgi:hypothetical protein
VTGAATTAAARSLSLTLPVNAQIRAAIQPTPVQPSRNANMRIAVAELW